MKKIKEIIKQFYSKIVSFIKGQKYIHGFLCADHGNNNERVLSLSIENINNSPVFLQLFNPLIALSGEKCNIPNGIKIKNDVYNGMSYKSILLWLLSTGIYIYYVKLCAEKGEMIPNDIDIYYSENHIDGRHVYQKMPFQKSSFQFRDNMIEGCGDFVLGKHSGIDIEIPANSKIKLSLKYTIYNNDKKNTKKQC